MNKEFKMNKELKMNKEFKMKQRIFFNGKKVFLKIIQGLWHSFGGLMRGIEAFGGVCFVSSFVGHLLFYSFCLLHCSFSVFSTRTLIASDCQPQAIPLCLYRPLPRLFVETVAIAGLRKDFSFY